jgi:peroxiredoxin
MIVLLVMVVFIAGASAQSAPKVGEMAPGFTLKSLDGKEETNLEQFREKTPVILFFGSYT